VFRYFVSATLTALFFSHSFGAGGRCGTMQFAENLKNPQMLAREGYRAAKLGGTLHSKKTKNFIIYYTTDGDHKVRTLNYIDSLAKYLEDAYKLHKDSLKMKGIEGVMRTMYYEETVPEGLYPVEVVDTGIIGYCDVYGLTLPDAVAPKKTQIAIENDFLYGADCTVFKKGKPFVSNINGDYSQKWDLALKVTVFHELYHSFQLTQFNLQKYSSFWLEASATGVEEIGAPEVNDYIDYLSDVFYNPGKSINSLEKTQEYGYATLYLFLFSELGPNFDSVIWDYFSKHPEEKFAVHLARLVDSLGMNAEILFHKYASHIFYSGANAGVSPHGSFWDDMRYWPAWRMKTTAPKVLPAGTFDFIKTADAPSTDSVVIINPLKSRNGDHFGWVLSRLLEKDFVPPVPLKDFIAYPNPWKPKRYSEIKFGPLPKNSSGVEIRSANGALLERIKGEPGDTLIWQPKKFPAPGILYYRTLPYGKNKVLMLEY
jgi:hypothetical protein